MSRRKRRRFPDWAEQDRASDLGWIVEHVHLFWPIALQQYEEWGRGAIVVDCTTQTADAGHPCYYVPLEELAEHISHDAQSLVREYQPETELVVCLFKPQQRMSSYKLRCVLKPNLS